jgi:hypothetical protein
MRNPITEDDSTNDLVYQAMVGIFFFFNIIVKKFLLLNGVIRIFLN